MEKKFKNRNGTREIALRDNFNGRGGAIKTKKFNGFFNIIPFVVHWAFTV